MSELMTVLVPIQVIVGDDWHKYGSSRFIGVPPTCY